MANSLPSQSLSREDIEQLRAREDVDGFIELASREHTIQNGGLESGVALVENTVIDLAFEDGKWEQTVLARDANDQEHLEEALEQLG